MYLSKEVFLHFCSNFAIRETGKNSIFILVNPKYFFLGLWPSRYIVGDPPGASNTLSGM